MRCVGLVALSIALVAVHVKAAHQAVAGGPEAGRTPGKGAGSKAGEKHPSLPDFIQKVLDEGWEDILPADAVGLFGVPAAVHAYAFDAPAEESADGRVRFFYVVTASTESGSQPAWLLLSRSANDKETGQGRDDALRVSTTGVLEKTFHVTGGVTKEGRTVRGSGKPQEKDPRSPEMQELLRYELEFWLKGMHRKPKPKEKPGPAGSSGKKKQP